MECPKCGNNKTMVKDSRKVESNVFRIRKCLSCDQVFYTEETEIEQETADEYLAFIKREYRNKVKEKMKGKDV